MIDKYQPEKFEEKWRKIWEKERLYQFNFEEKKKKFYVLVELPYTSGDLHIGHWFAFTTPDVVARYKRMNGYNVFFPIGFDAFGLPAENAAIKRGVHPKDWTMKNIETMTTQFASMGSMINNWDKAVITCLPEYYRWNQWIFLQMFKKGLIYKGQALSNWCPSCQTVLANENVVDGKCWRCDAQVEQKKVPQWFIKITAYGQRLIWPQNPAVDWPLSVREGQNNWIGRSEGTEIEFKVKSQKLKIKQDSIKVFTTRADTLFGVTAIVLAPEHWLVQQIQNLNLRSQNEKLREISNYVNQAKRKQEEERLREAREKTGVDTGLKAVHPLTGEALPIWIADYVLGWYGEGAVMLVPAHDERDYQFAKKYNLPIKNVILPLNHVDDGREKRVAEKPFTDYGILVNSQEFNGLTSKEAIEKISQKLEKLGLGKKKVVYHLRDWSISRQRYWGTPVPIIYCRKCWEILNSKSENSNPQIEKVNFKAGKFKIKNHNDKKLKEGVDYAIFDGKEYIIHPVPEKDLPVELPYEVDFTPKGKPPLATNEKWLKVKCPQCGAEARRDAETLDTFFDSSWYWFRYVSPDCNEAPFDKEMVAKLTPVDIYFGGAEHTLGHTLYARFFTKFFHDLGLVDYEEFALKRVQHGIVLGPDGNKMSKSKGNVINPDEQVKEYGADAVRLYLCFMMPYEGTGPWSDETIAGVYRFLGRVWRMYQNYKGGSPEISPRLNSSSKSQDSNIHSRENFGLPPLASLPEDKRLVAKLQKTIIRVTKDIERIKLNTAIAAMMEFLNEWEEAIGDKKARHRDFSPTSPPQSGGSPKSLAQNQVASPLNVENAKKFLKLLAPFAPFLTEEIWREVFGEKTSIHLSSWPKVEEEVVDEEITIPVQVNGKLRATIKIERRTCNVEREIEKIALENEKVKKYLEGKKYRLIYIEGKILNFVLDE